MVGTAPYSGLLEIDTLPDDKIAGCDLPPEPREFPLGEPGARTYVPGHYQQRDWMGESDTRCLMVTESETVLPFQWVEVLLQEETLAGHVIVNGPPRAPASPEQKS